MPDSERWAAIKPNADGSISVYVHNWILAGTAKNADEFWQLVHEAWYTPEKFWKLFYEALGRRPTAAPTDPKLASLSIDDLGL